MSITIARTQSNFEREPLIRPFGFKGGYMTEIWQAVAGIETGNGIQTACPSAQSILWSDASIFAAHSEAAGNSLMFAMTEFALKRAEGMTFDTPIDLLEQLLPETWEYGKKITGNDNLRLTFALNALVGVDAAAWVAYSRENGFSTFDEMIPEAYRSALGYRHSKIGAIPLMAYAIPMEEIISHTEQGYFFMKVKIGSDPDKDGDREKMLQWDMARVQSIHEAIGHLKTPYTANGKIPYYFDANGRYDSKERLQRLLEHCDKIGALDQIAVIEEPFPEEYKVNVADLGVRIAADESAHCDHDVEERISLGYGAIALKPIAKTLSMTLKIAEVAHRAGVPMFCADLTVAPIQVDWNKTFASRIAPLPGINIGVVETNGHQNYKRWEELRSWHPGAGSAWMDAKQGCFELDEDFFASSGAILQDSAHYLDLVFPKGH